MILYTAAHGGFQEAVPLGGGAAIANALVKEWSRTKPFEFRLIAPKVNPVNFSEREYARFSREFAALSAYRIFTIYHVDVVAYVSDIYLRGLLTPETTVKLYRRLRWALPPIAKLVWEKQEASVFHSRGLIMPSQGMKEVMLRCYPECPPGKNSRDAVGRRRRWSSRRCGFIKARIQCASKRASSAHAQPHFA